MKKIMLALTLALMGCQSSTQFGECVGVNDADRDPRLACRVSTRNVVLAILFSETVLVPTIVIIEELYCPFGKK